MTKKTKIITIVSIGILVLIIVGLSIGLSISFGIKA